MIRCKPLQLERVFGNTPVQSASRYQFRLDGRWIEYIFKCSLCCCGITFIIDEDGLRVGALWCVL